MESEYFNLEIVRDNFLAAKVEDIDVNLELYLKSFDELNKYVDISSFDDILILSFLVEPYMVLISDSSVY